MPKGTKGESTKRRDFLKLASLSVPAAAVVAATGTGAEAATVEDGSEGLRDTPHTRAYFESARF